MAAATGTTGLAGLAVAGSEPAAGDILSVSSLSSLSMLADNFASSFVGLSGITPLISLPLPPQPPASPPRSSSGLSAGLQLGTEEEEGHGSVNGSVDGSVNVAFGTFDELAIASQFIAQLPYTERDKTSPISVAIFAYRPHASLQDEAEAKTPPDVEGDTISCNLSFSDSGTVTITPGTLMRLNTQRMAEIMSRIRQQVPQLAPFIDQFSASDAKAPSDNDIDPGAHVALLVSSDEDKMRIDHFSDLLPRGSNGSAMMTEDQLQRLFAGVKFFIIYDAFLRASPSAELRASSSAELAAFSEQVIQSRPPWPTDRACDRAI